MDRTALLNTFPQILSFVEKPRKVVVFRLHVEVGSVGGGVGENGLKWVKPLVLRAWLVIGAMSAHEPNRIHNKTHLSGFAPLVPMIFI